MKPKPRKGLCDKHQKAHSCNWFLPQEEEKCKGEYTAHFSPRHFSQEGWGFRINILIDVCQYICNISPSKKLIYCVPYMQAGRTL